MAVSNSVKWQCRPRLSPPCMSFRKLPFSPLSHGEHTKPSIPAPPIRRAYEPRTRLLLGLVGEAPQEILYIYVRLGSFGLRAVAEY
jgi:hypothetical protein